jgi:hypothetical protein
MRTSVGRNIWIAAALALICLGTAHAQELPDTDPMSLPDAINLPTLAEAPGAAREHTDTPPDMVLFTTGADVTNVEAETDVSAGMRSTADLAAAAELEGAATGRRGPQTTLASQWTVSGFSGQPRASALNRRLTGDQTSTDELYSRSRMGNLALRNMQGTPEGTLSPTAQEGQLPTQSSQQTLPDHFSPGTSDIPDLTAAPDLFAGEFPASSRSALPGLDPSLAAGFETPTKSSIQTPGSGLHSFEPSLQPFGPEALRRFGPGERPRAVPARPSRMTLSQSGFTSASDRIGTPTFASIRKQRRARQIRSEDHEHRLSAQNP